MAIRPGAAPETVQIGEASVALSIGSQTRFWCRDHLTARFGPRKLVADNVESS